MSFKNTFLEKSILVILITSFAFSSVSAEAGIFKSIKKTGNGYVNDAGDVIDDAIDESDDIVNDVGGALSDAANTSNNTIRTSASQAKAITQNLSNVAINSTGDLIDSAGNVINEVDLKNYATSLLNIDPVTGLASIKTPFESSMMFNVALRNGAWKSVSDAIKQETVFIGLNSGASLLQIRNQLANFDDQVQIAFAGSSEFILDIEAANELGKGLKLVRGAFSQCAGSVRNIDDCFDDFINQFIQFYQYIRYYILKVTELKRYTKGEKFNEIANRIRAIERKSVKYFLPILENSTDALNFSRSNGSFSPSTSVQSGFEQFSSIEDIRLSLEATDYSYHNDPQRACNRVSLPIICDDFSDLSNVAINRFDYQEAGLSQSDAVNRKRIFNAVAVKAFGSGYKDTQTSERSIDGQMDVMHFLRSELFDKINWSQTQDQRIPYIVKDELLGGAGGAFIATDTDSIILLNEELFSDDTGLEEGFSSDDVFYARKVALEELGHWLNWRRCQYSDDMNNCASKGDTFGDSGAKFATASFINFENSADFINQLQEVSEGLWSQPIQLTLANGSTATYEGNPSLTDIQTALSEIKAKIRFRMRIQLGTPESTLETAKIGSSGIIEVNYTPPKRTTSKKAKLGDLTKYGYPDPDQKLFLGNIGIVFALENFAGATSEELTDALHLPAIAGELGVKSSIGISIPMLNNKFYANNLPHINKKYRDDNIKLSYSVSPYVFSLISIFNGGTTLKTTLDLTSSIWWGIGTEWPAKSKTVPFSITMAGITIGSTGVGCAKGVSMLTAAGAPISMQLKCALGAQLASAVLVSGTGALVSLTDKNVSIDQSSGWVNGVRIKFKIPSAGFAVETRFEALFSNWRTGSESIKTFGKSAINAFAFDDPKRSSKKANSGESDDKSVAEPESKLTFSKGEFTLTAGESISNHNRHLVLQQDGNLKLYEYNKGSIGRELWGTGPQAGEGYRVQFQDDGNLVIYNNDNIATWDTGTHPQGSTLVLQEDGNLVIYSSDETALWSTQTEN